ncbi:MAG: hypothetical protein P1U42_07025 [Phycisphaerales bacterium]|nr:hypothetical protein [Phycisphaerales bacterium]
MSNPQHIDFNPLAGLVAVLFPGAGHLVLGRHKRAIFASVGVLGLFFFGLLIGGIDTIDSKEDKIWFFAQALVGPPTIIADQIHQKQFKAYDMGSGKLRTGFPEEKRDHDGTRPIWVPLTDEEMAAGMGPPNIPGLGRINEIAMLSVVLAGMLNLIVFLDALMPGPDESSKSKKATTKPNPGGAA